MEMLRDLFQVKYIENCVPSTIKAHRRSKAPDSLLLCNWGSPNFHPNGYRLLSIA